MADGRSVARLFPLAPLAWHGTASSARSSASATDRPQRSQEESADSRQISTGQPASEVDVLPARPPLIRRTARRWDSMWVSSQDELSPPSRARRARRSLGISVPGLRSRDDSSCESLGPAPSIDTLTIDFLPRRLLSTASAAQLEAETHVCAICIEPYAVGNEIACMPCGGLHKAHWVCLRKWLRRSPTCPMCRWDLRLLLDEARNLGSSPLRLSSPRERELEEVVLHTTADAQESNFFHLGQQRSGGGNDSGLHPSEAGGGERRRSERSDSGRMSHATAAQFIGNRTTHARSSEAGPWQQVLEFTNMTPVQTLNTNDAHRSASASPARARRAFREACAIRELMARGEAELSRLGAAAAALASAAARFRPKRGVSASLTGAGETATPPESQGFEPA